MVALASMSPRRAARTPGRAARSRTAHEPVTEPPNKRRKLVSSRRNGNHEDEEEDDADEFKHTDAVSQTAPRARMKRELGRLQLETEDTPDGRRVAMQTRPHRERPDRYMPQPSTSRPRYSNAAAAAAASLASDGYKPREERSWEDFHTDLDIDVGLPLFIADQVDGRVPKPDPRLQELGLQDEEGNPITNGDAAAHEATEDAPQPGSPSLTTPVKRKPGRPPRRPESMLNGLGSPPAPRIVPLPTHNPKERLNLPKPSFRELNHFLQYEEDQKENKVNYVDRTMAHVGYQESDRFDLPHATLIRLSEGQQIEDEAEVSLRLESDGPSEAAPGPAVVGRVEYDMDEQDVAWLDEINEQRKAEGVDAIKPAIFEITMTQVEKEYHALEKRIPKPQPRHAQTHRPRSSSQAAVNGDVNPTGDEPDSKCAICDDGDCENANAIIFCDGCDLAVHQECYGVPFIPEGSWFCRKCKEIGRGTPTCIFCPNVDGAFKQTTTSRWSHLLCALWIPEVTIQNMTFMEPITDVDKVPKSRWKLSCYICQQKMGACIQCGNKNCYQAFHVTCARRAKLFLKMKSAHQSGLDTSALKALCDKHVPQDWRHTHDTDRATIEAKRWYKHAMKDRKWADSQSAALELGAPPPPDGGPVGDINTADDTIAVGKKRRAILPQKLGWRLSSGAPVVPAVVYNSVEASLMRFTIRKRKEFAEKVCKYWTLKREARRGAALLKRLQLQLESFSTMEITRRNFAGMGAVGRPRLLRRISFAEMLQSDMAHLTSLCAAVREREELRLREVEMLRELVDTMYFPLSALLWPILQRAQKLDQNTKIFKDGFEELAERLRERYYSSVSDFSRDLSRVFRDVLSSLEVAAAATADAGIDVIHSHLVEGPRTAEHMALSQEQKDLKRLVKRIVKAVKEPLEEAMKKEAELRGRELEEEIKKLESMGIFSTAVAKSLGIDNEEETIINSKSDLHRSDSITAAGIVERITDPDTPMPDVGQITSDPVIHLNVAGKNDTVLIPNPASHHTPPSQAGSFTSSHSTDPTIPASTTKPPTEPLSPPISRSSSGAPAASTSAPPIINGDIDHASATETDDVFAHGGVPWYLEEFDPSGTTVHEERYTGRSVLRDMSEELSDMDEDTLTELAVTGEGVEGTPVVKGGKKGAVAAAVVDQKLKKRKSRRQFGRRVR